MINTRDGSIEFDSPNIHFSRGMTLQEFRQSPAFYSFKLSQDLEPSFTYRCESARAGGRTFDVSIWFYSGVTLKISLQIVEPNRPAGDEYFHRDFLRETFGYRPEGEQGSVEYLFTWGCINAGDVKGSESDIWIHYAAS